jgi:hypothetical protein
MKHQSEVRHKENNTSSMNENSKEISVRAEA